ncbi:3'(2'), 5'-bisphosphate nucleotidase [Glaciecola punicea ACAM 611]|uniref:3'(2'),5'-bisphosphate nucleotidase CysQ n=1 Tax=Glaciecola punicea ACAM 611 TaxID=1121923 RepID=H5TBG7_9ALTE|nr:3'(2'),5'-bisphosphate nucleotidase CysQ [Glaciecola punicea]OFA30980.1 3'(2'),5'-bisphosphate nucleotidase [Glaciecola punicea]GAB55644.1 3'(2'), 5'-bisphosphate nucleotidase [Glaciecola punicea ACAM 611]
MSKFQINEKSIQALTQIAQDAGDKILDIYSSDIAIYDKSDSSPLTEADLAAHHHIVDALGALADLPILSEESSEIPWQERKKWTRYWLVDPLDGTKEFIKKNGEFTVNIALIEYGEPTFGIVHAPVLKKTYVGAKKRGAYVLQEGQKIAIKARPHTQGQAWRVVGSRSHQSPEINKVMDALDGEKDLIAMGSSLKLCLVAAGEAHLYPRVGLTSEWDTAAAHAIALAAGAKVTVLDTNNPFDADAHPLRYNQKESVLNPFFMVSC